VQRPPSFLPHRVDYLPQVELVRTVRSGRWVAIDRADRGPELIVWGDEDGTLRLADLRDGAAWGGEEEAPRLLAAEQRAYRGLVLRGTLIPDRRGPRLEWDDIIRFHGGDLSALPYAERLMALRALEAELRGADAWLDRWQRIAPPSLPAERLAELAGVRPSGLRRIEFRSLEAPGALRVLRAAPPVRAPLALRALPRPGDRVLVRDFGEHHGREASVVEVRRGRVPSVKAWIDGVRYGAADLPTPLPLRSLYDPGPGRRP
jgi:hypothetical protein